MLLPCAEHQFGSKGRMLLEEMRRSDLLTSYNEEGVRLVLEEMRSLSNDIKRAVESEHFDPSDTSVMTALVFRDQSVARNKRYLLAYLQRRLEIIEDMRHDHGTVLPPETTAKLSAKEVDYFKQYDTLLTEFMTGLDLDITADLQPPKHLYIEVLVLADYGDIMTASGPVMLKKDERLLLKRTDVEQLIRQGVLAETSGRR